jgi:hypothetical protein
MTLATMIAAAPTAIMAGIGRDIVKGLQADARA